MFKARIRNYWCDYCQEYTELTKGSIEEILEYFYDIYENSIYPGYRQFICHGDQGDYRRGILHTSCAVKERCGYRGSVWLEKITYYKGDGSEPVIIFSEHDHYISPKASKAFDDFAISAKEREKNKNFGDY